MQENLKDCGALVLEANHDPLMLESGPYPWPLKQRIKSRCGHLANSDARRLVTGGGAWIGDKRIDDPRTVIDKTYLDAFGEMILRAGKKRYFRIIIA